MNKITTFSARQNVYAGILIGFSFIVLTLLSVKILAPEIDTNAASQKAEQSVGPYTMSMSNDPIASKNITPTDSQEKYDIENTISVTNTCDAGATITMTMNSTTSNSLVRTGSDSYEKEIKATTTTTLDNYSWGYALDGSSNYYAVPKKGETAATIYNESAAQTNPKDFTLKFGVKVDNKMPSGAYTNDVIYTMTPKEGCLKYSVTWDFDGGTAKAGATYPTSLAWGETVDLTKLTPTRDGYTFAGWTSTPTGSSDSSSNYTGTESSAGINSGNAKSVTVKAKWNKILNTIFDISTMQEMTSTLCSNTTTPLASATASTNTYTTDSSKVPEVTLRDTRDNNAYTVRKLADGNCWMTQSLILDGGRTIYNTDSAITVSSVTLPTNYAASASTNTSDLIIFSKYSSGKGNLYNFCAATATKNCGSVSNEITTSICPKGWRLPGYGESISKTWENLLKVYSLSNNAASTQKIRNFPISATSDGIHQGNGALDNGSFYYWGRTPYTDNNYIYYLWAGSVTTSTLRTDWSNKSRGQSIRCVND